jgi:TonB-dependent SusC/RagA subfamily outer membrane receptor
MLMLDTPPNTLTPLYVVDGMLVKDSVPRLDAADIESITVLKDEAAKAQFGARARNGVVIITTKKSTTPQVVLDGKDADGKPMVIVADSIFLPMGNIHAQLPKSNH